MNLPIWFAESHADFHQAGVADLADIVGNVFHCQVRTHGTKVRFEEFFDEIRQRHNLEDTVIIHHRHVEQRHYDIQIFDVNEMEVDYVNPDEVIWTTNLTLHYAGGINHWY